jgi:hypothetical protein
MEWMYKRPLSLVAETRTAPLLSMQTLSIPSINNIIRRIICASTTSTTIRRWWRASGMDGLFPQMVVSIDNNSSSRNSSGGSANAVSVLLQDGKHGRPRLNYYYTMIIMMAMTTIVRIRCMAMVVMAERAVT